MEPETFNDGPASILRGFAVSPTCASGDRRPAIWNFGSFPNLAPRETGGSGFIESLALVAQARKEKIAGNRYPCSIRVERCLDGNGCRQTGPVANDGNIYRAS